jgi:N-acetylmuramoyl-L-alanine amidase
MLHMIAAWRAAVIPRTICLFILCVLLAVPSSAAARWNSEAAARAFEQARQKRIQISRADQPTLAQYLECAETYRKVYVSDPHYGRVRDAIYEEALVYQEAAERFSKPEYYRIAVRRFHLLVKDYGGNQSCTDALKRLAAIYTVHLHDEQAAKEAYKLLRTEYGYSSAAIQRLQSKLAAESASPGIEAKPAQVKAANPPIESGSKSQSTVQNLRFWTTSEFTRVIIDMDGDATYENGRLFDPDRVYLDIPNSKLSHDMASRSYSIKDEMLKQIRVAQNRPDTVRVVLDVSDKTAFSVSELHNPFRIIIDLHIKQIEALHESPKQTPVAITEIRPAPATEKFTSMPAMTDSVKSESPAEAQGKSEQAVRSSLKQADLTTSQPSKPYNPVPSETAGSTMKTPPSAKHDILTIPRQAAPTSRGDRSLTRTLGLKVGRIVIDPGHGGHDFGTIGPGGLLEKDIVLSLARSLQKKLQEKLGAEVFLTRDDDTFIPLEDRTAFANQHKADLFISLHANSSRIHSISGVETYYLDFAKNDAQREIAARENATTVNNVRDLEDLIKKIAQADKSTESRELASIIQKNLYAGARQVLPLTQNRGVRSAPFIVLIGANMPSILAEVAFISNPKDERLLGKEATRQNLINALFAGIDGYMKTLGTDVVRNQTGSQSK